MLDLSGLGLTEVPAEITTLGWLRVINLTANFIGGQGVKVLAPLSALKSLNLRGNTIGDEGAKALAKLSALESLDLSFTSIGDEGMKALANLSALTNLFLRGNNIGDEGAKALADLAALTNLDLSENVVGDEGAKALAKLTALMNFDLSFNKFGGEGALAIANLSALTNLNLKGNNSGCEGALAVKNLSALTHLDLSFNNIGDEGANSLKNLTALKCLALSGNDIGDEGAKALANLTSITNLDLSDNTIGCEGGKALANLTAITSLDLRDNIIGCEGAKTLAKLTAIRNLKLSNNKIEDWNCAALLAMSKLETVYLSRSSLRSQPEVWNLPSLQHAILYDCRMRDVPSEILSQSYGDNCLPRLRAYFHDAAIAPAALSSVKVMLLGNGAVGKTQIRRRLCGQDFEETRNSTHGVEIENVALPARADGADRSLQIWDFGGQDIYLGTHALFLRANAIFVVVWSEDSEAVEDHEVGALTFENFPLDYWVRYVETVSGPETALLVVQNKCDATGSGRPSAPLEDALLERFDFCRSGLHYSAKVIPEGADSPRGHESLVAALAEAVDHMRAVQGTPVIGRGWVKVKERLEGLRETVRQRPPSDQSDRWIDRATFDAWCAEAGDIQSSDALLTYLHRSGTVFWQADLFEGRIVVDQNWALEAIYALFHHKSGLFAFIRDRERGRFTESLLGEKLWDRTFERSAQALFLAMMRSCGICFQYRGPGAEEATYVAPELLPDREHAGIDLRLRQTWNAGLDGESATFAFRLLPPGLFRSFMADIGEAAGDAADYWRQGFYFFDLETEACALVEVEIAEASAKRWSGEIHIKTQRGRAAILLDRLCDRLLRLTQRFGAEPEVTRSDAGRATALLRGSHHSDSPERERPIRPGIDRQGKPQIYVSYAWGGHENEQDRAREEAVERLCAAAQKQGLKIIRDRHSMTFGDEIERFMNNLAKGDHIYIILSEKYLSSANCMYELHQIWRNVGSNPAGFRQRTSVLCLPDARVLGGGSEGTIARLDWAKHWESKLQTVLDNVNNILGGDFTKLGLKDFEASKRMRSFANEIDDILTAINDTLNPRSIEDLGKIDFRRHLAKDSDKDPN